MQGLDTRVRVAEPYQVIQGPSQGVSPTLLGVTRLPNPYWAWLCLLSPEADLAGGWLRNPRSVVHPCVPQ